MKNWLVTKACPWLKKYPWPILVFLGTVAGVIIGVIVRPKPAPVVPPSTSDVIKSKDNEDKKQEEAVKELEKEKQENLNQTAKEQTATAEQLKDKPPAEVGKWLDKLS